MQRNLWVMSSLVILASAMVVGCSLVKPPADPGTSVTSLGGAGKKKLKQIADGLGEDQLSDLIAPSRIALKVMMASRPIDDPELREIVWSAGDELVIDTERRMRLEANGLRMAIIDGALPPEIEEMLSPDAPQGKRIDPTIVAIPDGHATPILLGPETPAAHKTLFLSLGNGAVGRDYEGVAGAVRLTGSKDGDAVSLRIVPEIHHGADQIRFAPAENVGAFEPEQFVMRGGKLEENFRDLASNVRLEPDQILVIGSWPDRSGSLGHFLFSKTEPKSDRLLQTVVFIWATQTGPTEIPWVEPITPPSNLRRVDPSDLGLDEGEFEGTGSDSGGVGGFSRLGNGGASRR